MFKMPFKVPSRASFSIKPFFGFVSLLFYADPTWLDKLLIVVGFIAACAAGVPFPLIGIIFGQVVDGLNSAQCGEAGDSTTSTADEQSSINSQILIMVYLAIAIFVLTYTHIVCWNLISQRLAQRVRERYLRSLLKQDIAFFDDLQAGTVSSRLNADVQAIESGCSEKFGVFCTCVSFCITAYVIAFIMEPRLAGMLISLIPAFLIMSLIGGHYVQKYSTSTANAFASASSIASEGLSHVGLVHALGAHVRLEERFRVHLTEARKEGIKKAFAIAVQAGTLYFIAFAANALAYWQGSRSIADTVEFGGNSSVGQTYTVIFVLVDGSIVLSQVAPFLPLFGAAVAAYRRIQGDIENQPKIDGTSSSGESLPGVDGAVDFSNVSFTYPSRPEHTVLKDVSFQCEAGKLTAIVGLSGSGKSTVASLLARFYDPDSGSIAVDGHDLTNLNVKSLRGFISLVPQEPALLDRSILENIAQGLVNSPAHAHLEMTLLSGALAKLAEQVRAGDDLNQTSEALGPEVSEIVSLIHRATDLADATSFITRLEHGLATLVGSSGSLISGGQKQRIALARALVRDPKILILDEATAALDSASEKRIQAAIEKASQGRTVISIAHRLSTIRAASKIIVMRTGKVIEEGTHDELMSLEGGSYADMVRLQSVKSNDDNGTMSVQGSIKDDDVDSIQKEKTTTSEKQARLSEDTPVQSATVDTTKDDGELSAKSIFNTLSPMVRPYLMVLLLAFFAALIVGGTYPGAAIIFGNTIGSLTPCNTPDFIRSRGELLSGMFFMLACLEFFGNFGSWACFGYMSENLIYKVRVLSFRSLFKQPVQWHESSGRSPNKLLGYITNDGNALAGFSGSIIGTLFSVIINFTVAIIMCHIVSWRIAVVCLACIPLLLGAGFMQLRAIMRFAEKHAGAFSASIGITVEAVTNIRTVAALSLENEILQTYRRSLSAPRREMVVQCLTSNIWLAISTSLGNAIYALAYWWGTKNLLEGRVTQTEFFIVLFAMLVSAQLWGQLFTLAPEITRAKAAISRIVGLVELGSDTPGTSSGSSTDLDDDLNEKTDIEAFAHSDSPSSTDRGSSIEFNNVSFSYPARPNNPVLDSLSLSIKPGQFCALAGPSGAGKSTVLTLLERFYSPSSGSISINGYDISRHSGPSFRDEIAYVPQANVMFHGTVRFNLELGARPNHTPTQAELEEACKMANIHDVIVSLPQGYDTDVGSSGSQLSGGQRQRLSIARALVRKPRLLLLDESTSALDAESETALEKGLAAAVKGNGVTVIAIAHRLRTIARADVIFLIEGGKVVDQGKHEELVARSESYRVNALHQMMA